MKIWIAIAVLLLREPKVQCDQQLLCRQREAPAGVLALRAGSEVALGCRGDVTADGLPKRAALKREERLGAQGDRTVHRTSSKSKESPSVSEKHFGDVTSSPDATPYGKRADVFTQAVGTSEASVIATREGQGTGYDVSRPTRFTTGGGATEGGGAFQTPYETSESTESDDYDDSEETKNGARATRSVRRRAQWTRNGQPVREGVEKGGVLRFPNIQVANSGNYSCHRGDRLVSSVKLSVGVGPAIPSLWCYKRSHISKIRCEWTSSQPIVPRPQCSLLLTKGLEFSRLNCSYSPERSRCWCAFPCDEGDPDTYGARLCVSNTVGSALSPYLMFTPAKIVKPDSPTEVTAWPVEGAPGTLRITWHLPRTWKQSSFYRLEFCLRYRPMQATEFQEVPVGRGQFYLISDALVHTEYEIQLKAKDDFDGVWSEWSGPAYGRSWTAPVPTPFDVLGSLEPYEEGSGVSEEDPEAGSRPAAVGASWVNVVWAVVLLCVCGVCLSVIAACCFRHRSPSLSKKWLPPCGCQSGTPASPAPPGAPRRQSPHPFACGANEEGAGIHLHNVDYFFSSYTRDRCDS